MSVWDEVKNVVGTSAPIVGGLLGGNAGELVGNLVSSALGVDNTATAIANELKKNPDSVLKIKQMELDNIVDLRKLALQEKQTANEQYNLEVVQRNATIQAEIASNDAFVRRWRPAFGYAVCFSWVITFLGLFIAMVAYPSVASTMINNVVALTPLFGVALTVLGINIHKRSVDKQTSAGLMPVGVVAGIKSAITSKTPLTKSESENVSK